MISYPPFSERMCGLRFSIMLSLALMMVGVCQADSVVNGDFEQMRSNGKPVGWEANTANLFIETDAAGNSVLRFERRQPNQGMWATQRIKVESGWERLRVSARIKAARVMVGEKGYQTPRVQLTWLDANGNAIGYPGGLTVTQDTDWVSLDKDISVDPKAVYLSISAGNFGEEGDVWFDDISVIPNPPVQATLIRPGFPEGTFEPSALSGTAGWKLVNNSTIVEEGGKHFLRLQLQHRGSVQVARRFQLQPDWTTISLSVKLRTQNLTVGEKSWENARLQYNFEDASGKQVGGWPSVPNLKKDSDWVKFTKSAAVPEGAVYIVITPAMLSSSGTVDFDDLLIQGAGADEPPAGLAIHWGEEPEVVLSPTSSEIVLNGIWKFQPAVDALSDPKPKQWGWMPVPGSWTSTWSFPPLASPGRGPVWDSAPDLRSLSVAWYERPVEIPESWRGRRICIEMDRVSTDAEVFLNGKRCGTVAWPRGTVDITDAVNHGGENVLRIRVVASGDEREVERLMGTEAGHNSIVVQRLATRGIISDVVLWSQSSSPRVSSIGISPSTRNSELSVSFRAVDGTAPNSWSYDIRALELDGSVAKQWKVDSPPERRADGRWHFNLPWNDPELWDFENPHLYHLELTAKDGQQMAVYSERFGFREFWIDGRDFYLNGNVVRLRPQSQGHYYPGIREFIEAEIQGYIDSGFNIKQFWPEDVMERGKLDFQKHYASVADEEGLGVIAIMPSFAFIVDDWDKSRVQDEWRDAVRDQYAYLGNHPSILMWNTSANRFGHADDQNPIRIGDRSNKPTDSEWLFKARVANDGVAQIKEIDPSRPVMIHHGSATGDVYATNNYLNLIPLQEREDWLSHWAEFGDMPFMAVEFGCPLDVTFTRGRFGGHKAGISEFLLTEHAATYLGPKAYTVETDSYRKDVRERNDNPPQSPSWHAARTISDEPAAQEIIQLFVRNTWRSWRTYGISGGMIPWDNAGGMSNDWSGGYHENYQQVSKPPFVPGQRGAHFWKDHLPAAAALYYQPEGNTFLPSWTTVLESNSNTLAWIAGEPGAFTDKTHIYESSETVEKQIVLINDSLRSRSYEYIWSFSLDGSQVLSDRKSGVLNPGEIRKVPLSVQLPEVISTTQGKIDFEATIGQAKHRDVFVVRVHPSAAAPKLSRRIQLWDDGDAVTSAFLNDIGFETLEFNQDWDRLDKNDLLVIGEKALAGQHGLPEEVDAFIEKGGQVLILAQTPDWWDNHSAFRTSKHVSRRVWPTEGSKSHPIIEGLDSQDFRDWRGSGTVAPQTNYLDLDKNLRSAPRYGWHINNRGSVSGVALEKPHHSGWTPILECEFGLAFSPLMELKEGEGRAMICTLDLAHRDEHGPMPRLLAYRILGYFDKPYDADQYDVGRSITFSGSKEEYEWFTWLGLDVDKAARPQRSDSLWVIGRKANVTRAIIKDHAEGGGNVIVFDADSSKLPTGVSSKLELYSGRTDIPDWPTMIGVSPGDLHVRFDVEVNLLQGESSGIEIGADGLLGYEEFDNGSVVYMQAHPKALDKAEWPHLRFSQWQLTRLSSQLLSNLGASFEKDLDVLRPVDRSEFPIALAGTWRFKPERLVVGSKNPGSIVDPGPSRSAERYPSEKFNDSNWLAVEMPNQMEFLDEKFRGRDGSFWLRKEFDIPQAWEGRDIAIHLGRLDDFDTTYLNGVQIGSIDKTYRDTWNITRVYRVPGKAVSAGKNMIAIRIFDHFGGGGMTDRDPGVLRVELLDPKRQHSFYVEGYRNNREDGDDPFRYYRW